MTTTVRHDDRRRPICDRLDDLWCAAQPVVMGVLNCTPDSFSDGGRHLDPEMAVRRGLRLLDDGAAIVDVGGESTRPGADPVPAGEELGRTIPVLTELRRRRPDALLSIDTAKAEVAAAALEVGADIVNDVTAGSDPDMLPTAAAGGAAVVLMHMRGTPRTMQRDTDYVDVVAEVHGYLRQRADAAVRAGLAPGRIWLDPGIGFGKDSSGNLALLAAVPRLAELGHPVVVGPSRKSFIGRLTGAPVTDRLPGTLAAVHPVVGVPRSVVRVHDPAPVHQYLTIARGLHERTA